MSWCKIKGQRVSSVLDPSILEDDALPVSLPTSPLLIPTALPTHPLTTYNYAFYSPPKSFAASLRPTSTDTLESIYTHAPLHSNSATSSSREAGHLTDAKTEGPRLLHQIHSLSLLEGREVRRPSNATPTSLQQSSSNPFQPSTSAPRSPLSGFSIQPDDLGPGFRRSSMSNRPSSFVGYPQTPPSYSSAGGSNRRRSLTAPASGPLVGSYENSLMTGRMSAQPSAPLPFVSSVGVLGAASCPAKLRCPPHLTISFGASFYTGQESSKGPSPYVGNIDLEAHFESLLTFFPPPLPSSLLPEPQSSTTGVLPRFPGYRIPVKGQIQIVIKNPHATAVKLFLIPYDLTGLNQEGKGGKTFLRQKSYEVGKRDEDDVKGRLKYAVHLQFCSPPTLTGMGTGSRSKPRKTKGAVVEDEMEAKYYLYKSIRVVFAPRALDSSEKLRIVSEGPEGIITAGFNAPAGFTAYHGAGKDWEMSRKKAKEREKRDKLDERVTVSSSTVPMSALTLSRPFDPNHINDDDFSPSLFTTSPLRHVPLLSTPPSSSPPEFQGPAGSSALSLSPSPISVFEEDDDEYTSESSTPSPSRQSTFYFAESSSGRFSSGVKGSTPWKGGIVSSNLSSSRPDVS